MKSPNPYIDFHTHADNSSIGEVRVQCIDIDNLDQCSLHRFFTAGIHPWNASIDRLGENIARLMDLNSNPAFIGVGEIGLDKQKGPNLHEQIEVLTQQLEFANSNGKPVVIHCVKAWDELIAVKKKFPKTISWGVHGFNGSPELASQLIDQGFYLSIGDFVLHDRSRVREAIHNIPIEKLFLETDTSTVEIEALYCTVSNLLGIQIDILKQQIATNFAAFFKTSPLL